MEGNSSRLRVIRHFGSVRLIGRKRRRLRRFGVPPGGPFDPDAFETICEVARIQEDCSALEIVGGVVDFEISGPVTLIQVGARMDYTLEGVSLSSDVIQAEGGHLSLSSPKTGWTTYLSVPGGFDVASALPILHGKVAPWVRLSFTRETPTPLLRILPGLFDSDLVGERTISLGSTRRGVILEGGSRSLLHPIRSIPVDVGIVQETPDGTLIVVGPDGPTVGGYPPVGMVIEADLGRLAQLRPGTKVTLKRIEQSEACQELSALRKSAAVRRATLLRALEGL